MEKNENQGQRPWKWGIFCYDPNDPEPYNYVSTGVRSGRLTFNLAHKTAYLYFILFIGSMTALILLSAGVFRL